MNFKKANIFYILFIILIFLGTLFTALYFIQFSKNPGTKNERIISIAAACTEIIIAIGAGDNLVGVDQSSLNYAFAGEQAFQGAPGALIDYPTIVPNKTNVGSSSSLNLELLQALEPSKVFSWEWATSANTAVKNLGIEVITINPQSIDDILNLTETIGAILGKSAEAAGVVLEIQERLENITHKLQNISEVEKPLIYYELASLGKTVGPGTITNEMIFEAGGINLAVNETQRYPLLSSEYIVAKNPDIIVVVSYGASIEEIKTRAGWDNIKAVQNDRIYIIESGWVSASPRVVLGLEQFLTWFHPDLP